MGVRVSRWIFADPRRGVGRDVSGSRRQRERAGAGHRSALSFDVPPPLASLRGTSTSGLCSFQAGGGIWAAIGPARLFFPPADSAGGAGAQRGHCPGRATGEPRDRVHSRREASVSSAERPSPTFGENPRRGVRRTLSPKSSAAQGAVGQAGSQAVSTGLAGKVGLVTGGSRGIGRAAALSFAPPGPRVGVPSPPAPRRDHPPPPRPPSPRHALP